MFSNVYQNGDNGIEIFSPSGNDPFRRMKLVNESLIHKVYERVVKGYVVNMDRESSTTALICPKQQQKESLDIRQSLLIIQLRLGMTSPFSLELVVHDNRRQKKRLYFSTSFKDIHINSLHVSLPWKQPRHEIFTNVVIDLMQLVHQASNGADEFVSLDSFTIHPCCQLRRIFTLPRKYLVSGLSGDTSMIEIPAKYDFISGVNSRTWMYTTIDDPDDYDHHTDESMIRHIDIDGIDGHRIDGNQSSSTVTYNHHPITTVAPSSTETGGTALIVSALTRSSLESLSSRTTNGASIIDGPYTILHSTLADVRIASQHYASNPWGTGTTVASDQSSAPLHGNNENCTIVDNDNNDDDERNQHISLSDESRSTTGHRPLLFSSRLKKKISSGLKQQSLPSVLQVAMKSIVDVSFSLAPSSRNGDGDAMMHHEDGGAMMHHEDGGAMMHHEDGGAMMHHEDDGVTMHHEDDGAMMHHEDGSDDPAQLQHLFENSVDVRNDGHEGYTDVRREEEEDLKDDRAAMCSSPPTERAVGVTIRDAPGVLVDRISRLHTDEDEGIGPTQHAVNLNLMKDMGPKKVEDHDYNGKVGYRNSKVDHDENADHRDDAIDDEVDDCPYLIHHEDACEYEDGCIDYDNHITLHGEGRIDRYSGGDRDVVGCSSISDFQHANKTLHNQWVERFKALDMSTKHATDDNTDYHQTMDKVDSLLAAIDLLELQYVMNYGVQSFESELGFFSPERKSLYEL